MKRLSVPLRKDYVECSRLCSQCDHRMGKIRLAALKSVVELNRKTSRNIHCVGGWLHEMRASQCCYGM